MELKNSHDKELITSDKIISFIICSNGFGHFKRVILVSNEILKKDSTVNIHIFCSPKQIAFLEDEPNFNVQSNTVEFHNSFFKYEPKWLLNDFINITQWNQWLTKIKENKIIKMSDVVVSDNQVGPLVVGKKVILMGSFLWPFLNLSNKNKKFIEVQKNEKKLLREMSPNCICVEDIAMPDLLVTNQVKLPWFCEKHPSRNKNYVKKNKFNVLLTGGGTEMLSGLLSSIYKELNLHNYFNLFVDNNLFNGLTKKGMSPIPFLFDADSFNELDLIICRPGVGILTDVVKYNIPVIALPEKDNKEIMHNLMRVEELGLGVKYDGNIESILNFANNKKLINDCISKIEEIDTGGAAAAAAYILNNFLNKN